MRRRRIAAACLLLMACAPLCPAQKKEADKQESLTLKQMDEEERNREQLKRFKVEPGGESLPPALMAAFKPVELPEGEGSWVVQVVTRGGFAGGGRGDVTVYSDGRVECRLPSLAVCVEKDPAGGIAQLARLVAAAKPAGWKVAALGVCFDCYVTLLVVQRREEGGRAKVYTAHWDAVGVATAPADALRIHETALGLTVLSK